MAIYIAATRTEPGGTREVLILGDIYDDAWRIVGYHRYGWHPENRATQNGFDIDEAWWSSQPRDGDPYLYFELLRD